MTYEETLHYLYTSTPVFERSGAAAYKPGLETSLALDDYFNHPHTAYPVIHVGGTNGKGSVSHTLAAILQKAGYKVGLYTSPHLVDFGERIRVDGQKIDRAYVCAFVEEYRAFFEPLHPSFFELASTMAFDYFRREKVDIAVVEVGLGGRLDSTNIVTPVLSIITNISKDHTQFLGDTLGEIAYEKAGIIKKGVPVVIGEADDPIVESVFVKKAHEMDAPICFAAREQLFGENMFAPHGEWYYDSVDYGPFWGELKGYMQVKNTQTILCALRTLKDAGWRLPKEAVLRGFDNVAELTGLQGRWQLIMETPYTILDTGHNPGAWQYITKQIEMEMVNHKKLYMILGFSADKAIDEMLQMMPAAAVYYFTQAESDRAIPAQSLAMKAERAGLRGKTCRHADEAVRDAMAEADDDDMIFIGGSNYLIAEVLPMFDEQ